MALVNGAWTNVRDYVWLDATPLSQLEYPGPIGHSEGYIFYHHVDHIGLPRAMTNAAGQMVWNASPQPYGDIVEHTGTDPFSGRTVVTNLRLPGQYDERLLSVLGLQGPYYNWNRSYLPSMGRYLELDPIALEGELNTDHGTDWFGYAVQNPLRYKDPRGLCIEDACIGEAVIAAALLDAFWAALDVAVVSTVVATAIPPYVALTTETSTACKMSKGGKQNKENEFVRAARQQPPNIDPCDWLRAQYQIAQDSVTRMKIKLAQKVLGCRHKRGG
jgi:RHS repeat-associated protein